MKILKVKRAITFITIMSFMSFMAEAVVYPLPDDDTDNLPWYLQKDKQMNAAIAEGKTNALDVERRNAIQQDMDKQAGENLTSVRKPEQIEPDLKKKRSSAIPNSTDQAGFGSLTTAEIKELQRDIETAAKSIPVTPSSRFDPSKGYDANFDFNGDGLINSTDQIIIRYTNLAELRTSNEAVYIKIMNALGERLNARAGDKNYAEAFDINKDGIIDMEDYSRINVTMGGDELSRQGMPAIDSLSQNLALAPVKTEKFPEKDFEDIHFTLTPSSGGTHKILENDNGLGNYRTLQQGMREALDTNGYIEAPGTYGYIDDLRSVMQQKITIKDIINALDKQENKTPEEVALLDMTKKALEESTLLDEETKEEMEKALYLFITTEALRDLLENVDFTGIQTALTKLVTEQRMIYEDYLNRTEEIYENLAKILEIDIENDKLPDNFITIGDKNLKTKRKLLVENKLRTIDKESLSEEAIKGLDILQAVREEYMERLKEAIISFTTSIKYILEDKPSVSVSNTKSNQEVLMTLDERMSAEQ